MLKIVPKLSTNLSKMWNKILNLEISLFPALKEELARAFIAKYLSNELFFYNATDATKIPLRERPIKVEKEFKTLFRLKCDVERV